MKQKKEMDANAEWLEREQCYDRVVKVTTVIGVLIFLGALIYLTFFGGKPSSAYSLKHMSVSMGNGQTVSYYSQKNNILWVGDSRMVQMYQNTKKCSVVAVWGGHYVYGGDTMRIDAKKRYRDIKQIAKRMRKKFGKAYVVLMPTINDYTGGTNYSWGLNNYLSVYKKLKKMKRVVVLSPSIVKRYNGRSFKPYNQALRRKVKHYIPLHIKHQHYNDDRQHGYDKVHYSKRGLKYIRRRVHKYIKRLEA